MKAKENHRRIELGRHIVSDSKICGGQPTFKGTRIMVWVVLEQLDRGLTWQEIVREWDGKVLKKVSAKPLASRIWWSNTSHSKGLMLVLDENLPAGQRLLLRKRRIRFRVIGIDVANRGTKTKTSCRSCIICRDRYSSPWTKIFVVLSGFIRVMG